MIRKRKLKLRLNLYSRKIKNYRDIYVKKGFRDLMEKEERVRNKEPSRSTYFFYELMENDLIFNKFISYFTKKGEKSKHFSILYKSFQYIKYSIRQQPALFLTKNLDVENLFFDVWELHLKKRVIYIPKTLKNQRKFNCSFGFLMRKLFLFNKMLRSKMEVKASMNKRSRGSSVLSFDRIASFKTIEERLAFFLISTSFLGTFENLIRRYICHLNKIVLKNRFKLSFYKNSKKKKWRRKRKKGKLKLIKKKYLYFDIGRYDPSDGSIKPHKIDFFRKFTGRILDRSWKQGKWIL